MQKGIFSSIVTGVMAITLPTHAAMLLHLDAASPGSSPTDSWMDLSGNGNHFTNHDSILDHDNLAFTFGGPDPGPGGYPAAYQVGDADGPRRAYFERADDGVFDFDTDVTGTGTPFSIVAWSEIGVDDGDDFVSILMAKGATRANEWKIRPRKAGSNTELIFNEVPSTDRMYTRADATPFGFHLTMITHDGSGTVGGTKFYYNGVETAATYNEDNLVGTILNDAPVRIGGGYDVGAASGRFFEGSIGIIEVWDEVKDASYALSRFNGGNPSRVPEPSTLALLGLGGLVFWARRRSS